MSEESLAVETAEESGSFEENGVRARLRRFFSSTPWEKFITTVIVLNAISLGLATDKTIAATFGSILDVFDRLVLTLFTIEIVLRIFAFGRSFWRDAWSLFDFAVVSVALLPATGNLSIMRALRILRALRLISMVPSMRRVVSGLLLALPGMGSILALLTALVYVFAVMGVNLFGDSSPELFGDLGASAFTLFQVMTLEGWAGDVARPVMTLHPWSWVYFTVFILSTSFAVLNLFIGIIVDAMQSVQQAERRQERKEELDFEQSEFNLVLREISRLREEIRVLHTAADSGKAADDHSR